MTDTGLQGRKILLGVTGGIAAYKAIELVRRLREQGAAVRVVMTAGAKHFVTAQSFQAVSGEAVRDDLWDAEAEAAMGHIELARWADQVVIAPATADFMARLAAGMAGDLLSTLCLATAAPVSLAPAMNRQMWANAATQDNAQLLQRRGIRLIGPATGDQACGEVGPGRMAEPEDIVAALLAERPGRLAGLLAGRHVLLTAGPTHERIDPVRYISNHSSGKMGFAIARAAAAAGARVTLVAGPVQLATPPGVERIDVESAAQMHRAVHAAVDAADIFIATAAVADYRPAATAAHKLKKDGQAMSLNLEQTTDILASVAVLPDAPYTVGFAAETHDVERYAREKLAKKKVDLVVANRVGEEGGRTIGFGADDNEVTVLWSDGMQQLPRASKFAIAFDLVEIIAARLGQHGGHRSNRSA
ncbi:MAG: bifunctional phosphopantothenoylcysteine decarboxylase/phosphopantothenate--cysteine ligase CoaBC [Gammaproteobacteria bacterium]|nr:bifunctional phosphopantothenoylcysteine decarboxylase/phosphopantothenate--cysteine ligase CoaBC [Gammaproteobacteria bacterium]